MLTKSPAFMCRIMLLLSVAMLAACFLAVGLPYPMLLWLAAGAAAVKATRHGVSLWSHGTARMAWDFDLLRHGMLGKTGLIMGRVARRGKALPRPGGRGCSSIPASDRRWRAGCSSPLSTVPAGRRNA